MSDQEPAAEAHARAHGEERATVGGTRRKGAHEEAGEAARSKKKLSMGSIVGTLQGFMPGDDLGGKPQRAPVPRHHAEESRSW